MDSKRTAVAYSRVSALEQKRRGYGIDSQIRDVTVFAERHGLSSAVSTTLYRLPHLCSSSSLLRSAVSSPRSVYLTIRTESNPPMGTPTTVLPFRTPVVSPTWKPVNSVSKWQT